MCLLLIKVKSKGIVWIFFIAHISFKKIEILWGHLKIHAQEHYRATECLALATTNRIERKMREWNKRAFVLQWNGQAISALQEWCDGPNQRDSTDFLPRNSYKIIIIWLGNHLWFIYVKIFIENTREPLDRNGLLLSRLLRFFTFWHFSISFQIQIQMSPKKISCELLGP